MKALMVAMASLIFSTQNGEDLNFRTNLTDTFSDSVKSLFEDRDSLIVNFKTQNSAYRLDLENPQYADIKAMLENAQKINQKIKVIAIIPSMTIQKIQETRV